MPFLNDADNAFRGSNPVDRIYHLEQIVFQSIPDPGVKPTINNISQAGTLTVSWGASANAVIYEVYRNGAKVNQTTSRSFGDSGLNWGATYTYTVIPVNDQGVPGEESPPSDSVTIPSGTCGLLTPSNESYTNVTITWDAVVGATHYQVYKGGVEQGLQTALTKDITVTSDSTTNMSVRPVRNGVYGGTSGTHTYYSGRAQKKDVGSKTNMVFGASRIDSWRKVDDWRWLSNTAAQGTYGTYTSYKGVIYYGTTVYDALGATLGSAARRDKGTCTKCEVYLYKKTNTGSWGAITIGFYLSNSTASGNEPGGTLGRTRTSTSSGEGAYYNLGSDYGQHLGDATYRSIMLRNDGTTNYAQFTGSGDDGVTGYLRLSWSWDYETVSAKESTWSTP